LTAEDMALIAEDQSPQFRTKLAQDEKARKEFAEDLKKLLAVAEEVADVLILSLLLAHEIGVDPSDIILRKLKSNAKKYPVEKAKGRAEKNTEL